MWLVAAATCKPLYILGFVTSQAHIRYQELTHITLPYGKGCLNQIRDQGRQREGGYSTVTGSLLIILKVSYLSLVIV